MKVHQNLALTFIAKSGKPILCYDIFNISLWKWGDEGVLDVFCAMEYTHLFHDLPFFQTIETKLSHRTHDI